MTRLIFWTALGIAGFAASLYGGFTSRWPIFVPGLVVTFAAQFMLGTGLFLGRRDQRQRL